MADGDNKDLESTSNSQLVTIGQNIVQAINNLERTINSKFPGWVNVPATAASPGVAGQVAYAPGFFYICVSSNTWQRVAIATF